MKQFDLFQKGGDTMFRKLTSWYSRAKDIVSLVGGWIGIAFCGLVECIIPCTICVFIFAIFSGRLGCTIKAVGAPYVPIFYPAERGDSTQVLLDGVILGSIVFAAIATLILIAMLYARQKEKAEKAENPPDTTT